MPQATVVPFDSFRVLLSFHVAGISEDFTEAVPVVGRYRSVPDTEPSKPPAQFIRCFRVPLPPDMGNNLPGGAVIGINQPHLAAFPAHISPELVDFKHVVEVSERLVVVFQAVYDLVNHGEAHAEHRPDVADSASPSQCAGDEREDALAAAVLLVVACFEELAATVLAQIILLAVAFSAVLFYIVAVAMWTGDGYCFDVYTISLFTLLSLAYFL